MTVIKLIFTSNMKCINFSAFSVILHNNPNVRKVAIFYRVFNLSVKTNFNLKMENRISLRSGPGVLSVSCLFLYCHILICLPEPVSTAINKTSKTKSIKLPIVSILILVVSPL